MTPEAILSFRGVGFGYAKGLPDAVSHLDFDIPPASITAILGPNGAGKTTLLHLALGLFHPRCGEIQVGGKPIRKYSRRELSHWIGLVPQNEYMPYEFSVLEYVILGRSPYLGPLDMPDPQDTAIALQSLKTVGISHLADRVVHELSGGEIQLVVVARALAQQPRILLLDEPTSHLDLSNKHTVLKILHEQSTGRCDDHLLHPRPGCRLTNCGPVGPDAQGTCAGRRYCRVCLHLGEAYPNLWHTG